MKATVKCRTPGPTAGSERGSENLHGNGSIRGVGEFDHDGLKWDNPNASASEDSAIAQLQGFHDCDSMKQDSSDMAAIEPDDEFEDCVQERQATLGATTDPLAQNLGSAPASDDESVSSAGLFSKTFGDIANMGEGIDSMSDDDEQDEASISRPTSRTLGGNLRKGSDNNKLQHTARTSSVFDASEHNSGCAPGLNRIKTPAPPEVSSTTNTSDVKAYLSPTLRAITTFYTRAVLLVPQLPLAEHRYWVGILHINKTPKNFRAEKDFLWFKGNHVTTIRTLTSMYATMSARAEAAIELRLGGVGRARSTETLEQLDVLGQKKVFFWAVEKKPVYDRYGVVRKYVATGADMQPWDITRGIVPAERSRDAEVIELD